VNGYRFHTHEYTQRKANRKTINSGVVCEGSDKLQYYGRVEGIYELPYGFGKGLDPVVFKCHWFDPHRVKLAGSKLSEGPFTQEMMYIFWLPRHFKYSISRTPARTPRNVCRAGMSWSRCRHTTGRLSNWSRCKNDGSISHHLRLIPVFAYVSAVNKKRN